MEDDFEYGSAEDAENSVARYEEMIRNKDQYFFDAQAFEAIIDYYAEKEDVNNALQVIEFAINQHPYAAVFHLKAAQLHAMNGHFAEALSALDKAELFEPSDGDIYLTKARVLGSLGHYDQSLALLEKAL